MSFSHFLVQLFDDGHATAPPEIVVSADELHRAERLLRQFDAFYRAQLPAEMPELDAPLALYGGLLVYRAAQLLVYRELPAELIPEWLPISEPSSLAAHHYSVDLALRFLPDLVRLAQAAAPDDPLVERLRAVGSRWPLSSVGLGAAVGQIDIAPLQTNRALWRHYIDRVIQRGDEFRLCDPTVAEAVRTVAGNYPELIGKLGRETLFADLAAPIPVPPSIKPM